MIFAVTWLIIRIIRMLKHLLLKRYDFDINDNLKSRKLLTQYTVIERILVFIIVLFALGVALMNFESIRKVGISIFASAGVAGLIIGLAAQKVTGNILAGIQIAFTQPIRLDDVVVVEAPTAWDLRVMLRENLIRFIRDNYPKSLPRTRLEINPSSNESPVSADRKE